MITQPINVMLCAYWTLAIVPSMPAPTEGNRSPYLLFILFLHPLNISRYLYLSLSLSLSLCNSVSLFLCHCVSLSLYIFLPFLSSLSSSISVPLSLTFFLSLSFILCLFLSSYVFLFWSLSLCLTFYLFVLCLFASLSLCLSVSHPLYNLSKRKVTVRKSRKKLNLLFEWIQLQEDGLSTDCGYKSCTAQLHNFQNNCNGVLAIFMLSLSRQFWFRPGSFE